MQPVFYHFRVRFVDSGRMVIVAIILLQIQALCVRAMLIAYKNNRNSERTKTH